MGVCVTHGRQCKKIGLRNGPILPVKGKDGAENVGATPDLSFVCLTSRREGSAEKIRTVF